MTKEEKASKLNRLTKRFSRLTALAEKSTEYDDAVMSILIGLRLVFIANEMFYLRTQKTVNK